MFFSSENEIVSNRTFASLLCVHFLQGFKIISGRLYERESESNYRSTALNRSNINYYLALPCSKSKRKAMNRNWSNQKANPALKTKAGNKKILQIDKIQGEQIANRAGSYFPKGGHLVAKIELKVL